MSGNLIHIDSELFGQQNQGKGYYKLDLGDEDEDVIDSGSHRNHCYIFAAGLILTLIIATLITANKIMLKECPSYPDCEIIPKQKKCSTILPAQFELQNIAEVNITGQVLEHEGCYYPDAGTVKSVSLEGLFTKNQLQKLLSFMPNLETLNLDISRFQTVASKTQRQKISHSKLHKLVIANGGNQNLNVVYDFLSETLDFNLSSIELKCLVVVPENERSIATFLKQNSMIVNNLSIRNSTFTRNTNMFASLLFPKLNVAEIELDYRYIDLAPDNLLATFTAATPKLKEFSSNFRCSKKDRDFYLQSWKFMNSNRMICDFQAQANAQPSDSSK